MEEGTMTRDLRRYNLIFNYLFRPFTIIKMRSNILVILIKVEIIAKEVNSEILILTREITRLELSRIKVSLKFG